MLTRQQGDLLHAFAVDLIAKLDATGYNADVAVLDFFCLNTDNVTAAMAALFLKHY